MILMLGISFINDYTHVALFCSGIVLGLSLFILYRGYKEYKRSRNAKKWWIRSDFIWKYKPYNQDIFNRVLIASKIYSCGGSINCSTLRRTASIINSECDRYPNSLCISIAFSEDCTKSSGIRTVRYVVIIIPFQKYVYFIDKIIPNLYNFRVWNLDLIFLRFLGSSIEEQNRQKLISMRWLISLVFCFSVTIIILV